MLKQKELSKLKTGEPVKHFLLLNKIETKTTKANKSYLNLELRDKSAVYPAKVWDNFEDFLARAKEGDVVKVEGVIEEFNNQPQIRILSIDLARESDNVSQKDFLPVSERNLDEMVKELNGFMDSIQNRYLRELLTRIFDEKTFEKYIHVPAGKAWHHSYVHGLLEHTLEILKICDLMCKIHPELNRDILLTAAILHDFGKTEELTYENSFDYTDKGRLLGHITIAALKIQEAAEKINNFPEKLLTLLLHLVLSHQGKLEHASPVEPKTLEAIVLYHADELSAKTNAYKLAIKADEDKEGSWTRFLPLAGTMLFADKKQNGEEPKETLFD